MDLKCYSINQLTDLVSNESNKAKTILLNLNEMPTYSMIQYYFKSYRNMIEIMLINNIVNEQIEYLFLTICKGCELSFCKKIKEINEKKPINIS